MFHLITEYSNSFLIIPSHGAMEEREGEVERGGGEGERGREERGGGGRGRGERWRKENGGR